MKKYKTDAFYGLAVLAFFAPLYLLTRSQLLSGDGNAWVQSATLADPSVDTLYGLPSHFLQVPLSHGLWYVFSAIGIPAATRSIFLALSFAGTLIAIFFVGKIVEKLIDGRLARWIAAFLFGTSLATWFLWNGELYALPQAFGAAAIWSLLNGGFALPALLWSLAVLSHCGFALLAPLFGLLLYFQKKTPRIGPFLGVSASLSIVLLLCGGWLSGNWHDGTSMRNWLSTGLNFSATNLHMNDPLFVLGLAESVAVIAALSAPKKKPCVWYKIACLFCLVVFFALNLFGAILPIKGYGEDVIRFQTEFRAMGDDAAFISCNGDQAVYRGPNRDLVLRTIVPLADVREKTLRWASRQTAEGKTIYTLGKACAADAWPTNLDLSFLEQVYRFHPTHFRDIPLNWTVQTDPYNWRRADLYRLDPK